MEIKKKKQKKKEVGEKTKVCIKNNVSISQLQLSVRNKSACSSGTVRFGVLNPRSAWLCWVRGKPQGLGGAVPRIFT